MSDIPFLGNNPTDSITKVADYIDVMLPGSEKMKLLLFELKNHLTDIEKQPELAIHEIRKRTKFLRALLLLQPDSPPSLNTILKKVSRFLAPYRDTQVNLDVYQATIESFRGLQNPELEKMLRQDPLYIKPYPEMSVLETMDTLLAEFTEQLQISASTLSPALIFQGVEKSFESGRKALENVRTNSRVNIVHAWRKKTKRLWYQLRLLFGDEQEELNHPLVHSNELGSLLGEIHDLDVFTLLLTTESTRALREAIQEKRQQLLIEALALGETFYIQNRTHFYQLVKQTL